MGAGLYWALVIAMILFVFYSIVKGCLLMYLSFKQIFMYLTDREYRARFRSYNGNMFWLF